MFKGNFVDNLGKIYGLYTGGFLVFFALMAVFEQMGMGADMIGILFVAFTIVIYAAIGVLSRTMEVDARRRPAGAARLQRHGDGGGLDVGRLVRGAGGRHLLRPAIWLSSSAGPAATCW